MSEYNIECKFPRFGIECRGFARETKSRVNCASGGDLTGVETAAPRFGRGSMRINREVMGIAGLKGHVPSSGVRVRHRVDVV